MNASRCLAILRTRAGVASQIAMHPATRASGIRGFNRDSRNSRPSQPWNNRSDRQSFNRGDRQSFNRGDRQGFNRGSRFNKRSSGDDLDIINRNRSRKALGDGLLGKPDYELDTEGLGHLEWTDLVPEDSAEKVAGMSSVPTEVLAEKRLLSLPLVNSLVHNRKYEWLTPVQAQTLIPILRNESVVVRAKTGTGKTAAFAIPTIQKCIEAHKSGEHEGKVKAVIISPTRELAQQIADEISKILYYGGLGDITVQAFVGGLSKDAQLRQGGFMRGGIPCDIVVATPGRLLDILDDPNVLEKFDNLVFKVFDEADRLLDIGFERMLAQIRDRLDSVSAPGHVAPLLLFSATADRNVRNFAYDQFGSRVKLVDTIPKNEPTANELVDQSAVVCPNWADVYEASVAGIMKDYESSRALDAHFKAIVFMPTVAMVDNFERILRNCLPKDSPIRQHIMGIHGKKTQSARQRRADTFRKEKDAILITTDVIARGMDFPLVTNVYQIGVPGDVASYVHRIGRTARIGNRGKSTLFFTNDVRQYLDSLARENIRPQMVPYEPSPDFHDDFVSAVSRSLRDEEETRDLMNSLLSYMGMLKSKYPIQPAKFLEDLQPFVALYELDELPMSNANRQAWTRKSPPQRRFRGSGFGSSRKSRMRW